MRLLATRYSIWSLFYADGEYISVLDRSDFVSGLSVFTIPFSCDTDAISYMGTCYGFPDKVFSILYGDPAFPL